MLKELAMLGLSIGGGLMSMKAAEKERAANSRAALLEYRWAFEDANLQNEQLLTEVDAIRVAAGQQETARVAQTLKLKSSNRAVVAAAGVGFNASLAVAERESDRALRSDLTAIGYNAASARGRIADQIRVNRRTVDRAKHIAAAKISGATARAVGIQQSSLFSIGDTLLKHGSSANSGSFGDIGKTFTAMMGGGS